MEYRESQLLYRKYSKNSEIPPLVLFCKNERFEIIDGRQRYETILRFVERRFKLSNKGLSALSFEAGALSKAFNNTNVSPFLFGLKPSDIKKSPLLQFQSTLYEKKDFTKLILSINNAVGNDKLDEGKLKRTFEVWWDKLKTKLDAHLIETTKTLPQIETKENTPNTDAIEEILELTREQFKILRNPETLFPIDYIKYIFKNSGAGIVDEKVLRDLDFGYRKLKNALSSASAENPLTSEDVIIALRRLERAIVYLIETSKRSRGVDVFGFEKE